MDLLNNKQIKREESKGKKMVKILLIMSIILFVAIVLIMVFLSNKEKSKTTLTVNGQLKEITQDLFINDNNGTQYISIKDLASLLGYQYYGGDYISLGVDNKKCYIKNENLISGFEMNSKKMYKHEEGTNLDYQYYDLKNQAVMYNDKLYISLNDLRMALNVSYQRDKNNKIVINSMEYLNGVYSKNLKSKGFTLDDTKNNLKALAYGMIIAKKDNQYSILNTKYEEIVAARYASIYFNEYNLEFIVSNLNGRYGIISYTGTIEQSLAYDGMEILNYENMIYKVKYNEKFGIVDKEGELLTEVVYDEIGYPADEKNKIINTVLIEDIEGTLIVVKQNEFYGLVRLEDGEVYLPCDHLEKIYGINELGEIKYKVEVEGQTLYLEEYLELREII